VDDLTVIFEEQRIHLQGGPPAAGGRRASPTTWWPTRPMMPNMPTVGGARA